jgi:hypothetical protein
MKHFNTLYYSFKQGSPLVGREKELIIPSIMEESTPSSSCWFRQLPLIASNKYSDILEFFSGTHSDKLKGKETDVFMYSAKVCPAVHNMLSTSILVRAPADIMLTIDTNGEYVWNTTEGSLISITEHPREQVIGVGANDLFEGKLALKFNIDIYIAAKDSFSLMLLQPQFHNKVPFTVLNGLIPSKFLASSIDLNVIGLFDIPKETPVTHYIKQGQVLAYMWAENKVKLEKSKHTIPHPLRRSFLRGFK